jgi:hypothetical protein
MFSQASGAASSSGGTSRASPIRIRLLISDSLVHKRRPQFACRDEDAMEGNGTCVKPACRPWDERSDAGLRPHRPADRRLHDRIDLMHRPQLARYRDETACHPERSEGSRRHASSGEILRCAQNDSPAFGKAVRVRFRRAWSPMAPPRWLPSRRLLHGHRCGAKA